MAKKSDVPFGAQFSPNQVNLPRILQIIHSNAGDRSKIVKAIQDEFFTTQAPSQQQKLAENTVLSLQAYHLLEKENSAPTEAASDLFKITDQLALHEQFARHILVNLKGMAFIETLEMMQAAGEEITLHTLSKRLEQRGVHVPRGTVHLSSLRLWLAQAGIFDVKARGRLYEINQEQLRKVLGVDADVIDKLTQLTASQRAFLRALTRITERVPLVANQIADLATTLYGVEYNHKELPHAVLLPLQELGYIQITKTTAGRGGKPYQVLRTPKFFHEISEPILHAAAEKAGLVPKELFGQPLAQILDNLKSSNKHVKGKALELLAIYLTRLIDLEFKGWRTRSADTGGAEVDAIVEGARLIFSRWQIQAKNTLIVRLEDVAKEVGLALTFIYSNVVMIITTGNFTKDACTYASHVMKTCNLNVILLCGSELERISQNPASIVTILNNKARQAMRLKERRDYFAV